MRAFGVSLLALAASLPAAANETVGRAVQGDWLVLRADNLRAWVLLVRKHKEDGPGRSEFYAYYGPNGASFPAPFDIVFETGGARLALVAGVGSTLIEATHETENLFVGTLRAAGKSGPVRLERLPEGEIRKRVLNVPPIRKDAKLEMIYLSADDCRYCMHWELRAKGELLASAEGKSLRFVEVKGDTLAMPIQAQHYPPDHRWVFEQVGPSRGVPRFLLAIDGQVMLNAAGTGGYNDVFLPAVKQVVARRAAGN